MGCARKFEEFSSTSSVRADLKRSSLAAFSQVILAGGGEFILRIASTAILARLISPEQFGVFMMAAIVTTIADQFRDLGLSTATIQREHINHREVSNLFWINSTAGLCIGLIACASAPLVAGYFGDLRLTAVTVTLSLSFLFGGMTVQHEALLARQLKHGPKAAVRLVALLLSTVLAVVMAAGEYGYWALVWREVARSLIIVVGVWLICPWLPGLPDRKTDVRAMLGFGANLTLAYFLGVLSSCMDRFIIGRKFGADPVALYRQPYQLVVAPMNQFMGPLYQVALPSLSMLQSEPERYRRFFRKIVSAVAMISMPLSVYLAIYSSELTMIFLGPNWSGAAPFFLVCALGGFFRSVVATIGFVLVSRGQSGNLLKIGALQSVVMVVLMYIGALWGAIGVAVGEALTSIVMLIPWLLVSFRGSPVPVKLFFEAIARPCASGLAVGIFLLGWRWIKSDLRIFEGVIYGGIVAALAVAFAWMVLPGGRDEIKGLIQDLTSKMFRKTVKPTSTECSVAP